MSSIKDAIIYLTHLLLIQELYGMNSHIYKEKIQNEMYCKVKLMLFEEKHATDYISIFKFRITCTYNR